MKSGGLEQSLRYVNRLRWNVGWFINTVYIRIFEFEYSNSKPRSSSVTRPRRYASMCRSRGLANINNVTTRLKFDHARATLLCNLVPHRPGPARRYIFAESCGIEPPDDEKDLGRNSTRTHTTNITMHSSLGRMCPTNSYYASTKSGQVALGSRMEIDV